MPCNFSNTSQPRATYSGILGIVGAALGTIIAPGVGTIVGSAGGMLLGLIIGFTTGIIEDYLQQSYFDRMTEVEKFDLLSEEKKAEYLKSVTDEQITFLLNRKYDLLTLTEKTAYHELATDKQNKLLKSVRETLKPTDIFRDQ